ncbi:MAG: murein L,D-transpeptidase catalytic domain family protein [Vicinamibacterales bacterium]
MPSLGAAPLPRAKAESAGTSGTETSVFEPVAWQDVAVGNVGPKVFALALHAAAVAVERGDVSDPGTLTVIDFSQPSTKRRMWIYDLRNRTLLFEDLVSHGRGSGVGQATSFSNQPDSNRSSLGLYRTAETYVGKHGYSLRLDGLERGFNDRARERDIVMHAADYVNAAAAKAQGYLGRSLGCPAVRPEISRQMIDSVKRGGLLFAYYPDPLWLETSKYLP